MNSIRAIFVVLVALCTMALVEFAHAGQYYKWKDGQGVVHYSQTPPPNQPTQSVFVSDTQPPPGLSQSLPHKGQAGQAADLRKVDAQASAANCATAKLNIDRLQHSRTIVSTGDADTARTLDSDQRRKALEVARRQQARYCVKQ